MDYFSRQKSLLQGRMMIQDTQLHLNLHILDDTWCALGPNIELFHSDADHILAGLVTARTLSTSTLRQSRNQAHQTQFMRLLVFMAVHLLPVNQPQVVGVLA